MDTHEVVAAEEKYLVPTYRRPEVVFTHGEGAYLYDAEGRRYLDFAAGIAVNALGHADAEWLGVVRDQAGRLTHISNLYHSAPHVELARRLVESSFADKVFFCNSGSEANETALKFARKYARVSHRGSEQGEFKKTKIVAFSASFHGRTMGALSTTYKSMYRDPFGPLVPGVTFAAFNDLDSARASIDEETCAVIIEPVQGEGGVNPARPECLAGVRELCDRNQALLIFDEVQCGLGRSGNLWAHQAYGVTPDLMTLAKPLAGGLPIGAALVTEEVAGAISVGDHGSTFAGGPLVCRAAQVVFDRVNRPEFLSAVRENGAYLMNLLQDLPSDKISAVRGVGLLVGLEMTRPVAPLVDEARANGLLIINAGETVIRICPPLVVSREQIETAVALLGKSLAVEEA
jgi:predicted acetylornithine/succinylornithine family transaminase